MTTVCEMCRHHRKDTDCDRHVCELGEDLAYECMRNEFYRFDRNPGLKKEQICRINSNDAKIIYLTGITSH